MIDLLERKRWAMTALAHYQRWVREGKPKHGVSQCYYDGYHECITPLTGETYRVSIQVSDSPDGDSWWTAIFKTINGGTDVVFNDATAGSDVVFIPG